MRVSTRCRSVDEFIAAFAALVDEHSIVVYTNQTRELGTRQLFAVQLADGELVLRGEGEVMESEPPPRGKLRLRFLSMDARSHEVHKVMMERARGLAGLMGLPPSPAPRPAATARPVTAPAARAAPATPLPGVPPIPEVPVRPRAAVTVTTGHAPASAAAGAASTAASPSTTTAGSKLPAPTRTAWSPSIPSIPMAQPIGPTLVTTSELATGTSPRSKPVTPELASGTPPPPPVPRIASAPPPITTGAPPHVTTAAPPPVTTAAPPPPVTTAAPPPPVTTAAPPPVAAAAPPPVAAAAPPPVLLAMATGMPPVAPTSNDDDLDEVKTSVDTAVPSALLTRPAPPVEERTPGSPYILPANPFGELDPKALEYFVECTIFEDTGQWEVPDLASTADVGAAEAVDEIGPLIEPPAPASAPPASSMTPAAPATPAAQHHPYPSVPIAALSAMAPAPLLHAPAPVTPAPGWPDDYAGDEDDDATPARDRRRRVMWIAVAVVGVIAIGVIAAVTLGSDDRGAPAVAPSAADAGPRAGTPDAGASGGPDASAAARATVATDAGATAPASAADAAVAETTPIAPPKAAGACQLAVTSNEDETAILIDGERVGEAPWSGTRPCGEARIVATRARYVTFEHTATLRPDEPTAVEARMVRPEQKVTFTSSPAGARISVDGRVVGTAPVSVVVKGFTTISVKAELAGYTTASQRAYVRKATTRIGSTLKKLPKRPRR